MNDYKNILLAVDFTHEAHLIAERARAMAKQGNARLTLLHVVEYLPPMNLIGEPSGMDWVIDEEVLRTSASASLKIFATENALSESSQVVVVGMPRVEINRIAREQGSDLIVLGSHGRHGLARLLGSTARAVINDAPCDVLAVRVKQ